MIAWQRHDQWLLINDEAAQLRGILAHRPRKADIELAIHNGIELTERLLAAQDDLDRRVSLPKCADEFLDVSRKACRHHVADLDAADFAARGLTRHSLGFVR